MQVTKLSTSERASSGFTHRFVLSRTSSTVSDWQSSTIVSVFALTTGLLVRDVAVRYVTASDATTSCTMSVGDTGSAVRFIGTTTWTGTVATYAVGAATVYTLYTAANTLRVAVTESGAATVGEFHVMAAIIDLGSLDTGVSW